jgi:hypothetical protein
MEMPNSGLLKDFDKQKELIKAKPVKRTKRKEEVSANLYRVDNLQKFALENHC